MSGSGFPAVTEVEFDGNQHFPVRCPAIGGLAGAYTGARLQQRLPDVLIRRVPGALVIAIGARYLWSGLS